MRSWLRIIDPAAPSPLATLMLDVEGAPAYIRGDGSADDVGLTADDAANTVTVDLVRPAAEFVTVVASPTFGIVPPGVGSDANALRAGDAFVASGGYRLSDATPSQMTLTANPAYWAGPPAIGEITVITDLGGASGVDAFQQGEVDYTFISEFDASWISYDPDLGPQLREVPTLSVDYYGFDASRPPFDDVLRSTGLRGSRRLAADRRPCRVRPRRRGDLDGPARDPRAQRSRRPARRTTRTRPERSSPRRAIPAARASPRPRC